MSLVLEGHAGRGPAVHAAAATAEVKYGFLLGRHIDTATLSRACALAAQWGVHPHDVLIANGWLSEDAYYRALAETTGLPFKDNIAPRDAVPPAKSNPRQCLAQGLLKERAQARRIVFAPGQLRPNTLRAVLAQLGPCGLSLATPRAVRDAVHHHFAPALARGAVETLAARRPDLSARGGTVRWQRLALVAGGAAILTALVLAPLESIRVLTLFLALLFVPVIGLRAIAAYALARKNRRQGSGAGPAAGRRASDLYHPRAPLP